MWSRVRAEAEAQAWIFDRVLAAALVPSAVLFTQRVLGRAWRWKRLLSRRRRGGGGDSDLWRSWATRARRWRARWLAY